MTRPQPSPNFPISEGIVGIGSSSSIRSTSEVYFPFIQSALSCTVHNFHFEFLNMKQAEIKFDFEITGEAEVLRDLYRDEEWKIMATENFLKSKGIQNSPLVCPVFSLMLSRFLFVQEAKISIDGRENALLFDQSVDTLLLPESHPPVLILPDTTSNYIYYDKKSTVFYTELMVNKLMSVTIELETAGGNFEFAPLFPYKEVIFKEITFDSSSQIGIDPGFQVVSPLISKELPRRIAYNLQSKRSLFGQLFPMINPAYQIRGLATLFLQNGEYGLPLIEGKGDFKRLMEITLPVDKANNSVLSNYRTYRFVFGIMIPMDASPEIIVRIPKNPIPSRTYKQMQTLPEFEDVLVEYEILNLGRKTRRLRIHTEIIDFTDISKKTFLLHGIDSKNGKKPVIKISQTPKLKRGILETIKNSEKATLSCKVFDEDSKENLYDETFELDILPNDQMLWSIKSASGSTTHNLAPFISAWIYPNDSKGLMDQIRAKASRLHPDGRFVDPENLSDIDLIVESIYKQLEIEEINYVNQPFTSKMVVDSQRVLTPETVLENKVGNCIDLTVMFASILMGLGIHSLIFLTPNHAFIGWGNKRKTEEMIFLETTCLGGGYSYAEAKQHAKETFIKDFLFVGSTDPLPDSLTLESRGSQIIDLEEVIRSGICGDS